MQFDLRDSIWQFILGASGIITAVFIYWLQRSKKSLSYQILSETPLVTNEKALKQKIQILFEGETIPDAHLIVFKVFNDGNTPILSGDFAAPPRFFFGEGSKILSVEVTDSNPKSLKPTVTIQPSRIEIEKTLLNNGDTLTVAVLLSKYKGDVNCEAHIVGIVGDVKRTKGGLGPIARPAVLLMFFVGILSLVFGSVNLLILMDRFAQIPIAKAFATGSFTPEFAFHSVLILSGVAMASLGLREMVRLRWQTHKQNSGTES
jgi:hypothetical protein